MSIFHSLENYTASLSTFFRLKKHFQKQYGNSLPIRNSVVLICVLLGCNGLTEASLPEGVQSPSTYNSPEGAQGLTIATAALFKKALYNMSIYSGIMSDELIANNIATSKNFVDLDSRELLEGNTEFTAGLGTFYPALQTIRSQARLARGVVAKYAPDFSLAVRGKLYAFEAYAELFLADLFCSGIPLSTLDFERDFTYRPGSTTQEVYEHAAALFDSALALSDDSTNIQTLARVGKGRALLALGRYDDAADAVSSVIDGDAYRTRIPSFVNTTGTINLDGLEANTMVSDQEGENGLPYRSSNDPRTASGIVRWINTVGMARFTYLPDKYKGGDSVMFTVGDDVEAKLIRAEAALKSDKTELWLQLLNELRTDGSFSRIDTISEIKTTDGVPDTSIVRIDTVWIAGTGGVAGLGPLKDPTTPGKRLDLMFSERAAWLFMTGHRQGDLRRLTRLYGRSQETVYPTGVYYNTSGVPLGIYGGNVTVPIPDDERRNPLFHGCLSRD